MTGKVAIITDASRDIGGGLVTGYRARGWVVVATASTITPSQDPGVVTVAGDIANPAISDQVVGVALGRFGRVDTLVNNVGVVISEPFTGYSAADHATAVGAGLTGFFWLTERVIGEMAARYGGHVVNVSATPAEVADSGTAAVLVALAKGAVVAATRSLAVEYAAYGIRVNAVSTGVIQTPGQLPESYDGLGGRLSPLGRGGRVSDVVDGVLFLESAAYITGEVLHTDGGQIASR
jgi:NAD(P)-dependent dehydrogenase (short-subunit alcohol dehydrogenase family)